MLGKVIGNYKLEAELGRGAHGIVYRALDQGRRRMVAIKALHSWLTEKAAVNERLRQLAPSIAQLRHPQLAEFYTILQQGADLYLVHELIEGQTLAATLRKVGVYSAQDAARLVVQICEPLVWLGRANWAHGDLKPTNILIAPDQTVRITDLGLAYALGDQAVHSSESGLAYRAPEQLRGGGFDARSDVYSLGAIFYELVTGLLPFRRANDEALRQAHLQDPVPSPRNYFPLIPVAVEALLVRALAKNPEDRFASVADFQAALRDWLTKATATNAVKAAMLPVSAPDTNEGPAYQSSTLSVSVPDTYEGPAYHEPTNFSVETARPLPPTIPELPPAEELALPLLPGSERHTRPIKPVADLVETSRLPQKAAASFAPAPVVSATEAKLNKAPLGQAVGEDEVVIELDDASPAPRKKGVLWLAVAGLAALVGIPYAMMRNVDSTGSLSNLPSRSTFSVPSPTATETPEPSATPETKASVAPRTTVSPKPKASPTAFPKVVPKPTFKPLVTPTPNRRVTPMPTPMPAPTARQIYPTPTPTKKATATPTPQEKKGKKQKLEEEKPKEKERKKGGVGGFFKDILRGRP